MVVYWRIVKNGQNLIFSAEDDGNEERVGGYRETKRGIDAYAATFGYEPGRSQKDFDTVENAKAFVESFRPWELYGAEGVTVDLEVRPTLDSASSGTPDTAPPAEDNVTADQPADIAAPDQPADIATPDQPADIATPDRPADIATPDQPEEIATPDQPMESIAPESQPSRRWWEFWKSS